MGTHPVWPSAPRAVDSAPGAGANDWIFADPRSQALLADIEQIAPSDASILISGETGTGKALIARHIHDRSLRRDGPFVVVSCGAFSESLVDAELFGYESGAFAGAFGAQQGWFEEANGGTIFLDEINDLALPVQNKLLRVLQTREVIRLGGRKPIPVDLRILAATSVDLEQLVADKRFRKDLYYRLNVVGLNVLTLRERPGDIVPLARYFIDAYSRRLGYPQLALTPDAEQRLIQAPWHGNVRELENVIHRSLLRCERSQIDAECLRLPLPLPAPCEVSASIPDTVAAPAVASAPIDDMTALRQVMRRLCTSQAENLHQTVEDTLLYEAFRCSNYSQSETSRLLGISRNVVRARLIRLGEISPHRKAPVGIDDDNDSDIHLRRTS